MTAPKKTTANHNKTGFFCTFATVFGPAAIAWRADGIIGLLLPPDSPTDLKRNIATSFVGCHAAEPSGMAGKAIKQIQQYFAGQPSKYC